mmetsp:Transcript_30040/g.52745  ORF Transcript_30040/g.52745 Transcript_30040/m.52745 type:complete len:482 (-) Transcript_30040:192-1637(-)
MASNPQSPLVSPKSANGSSRRKKIRAEDFNIDFGQLLGEGSFAKVFLATHKESGKQFAAKIVDKAHVVKHNKIDAVLQEKKVLSECKHPSIVHLHYAFQNKYSFFFMLELVPGGELFELIQSLGKLPIKTARFYAAELINVLDYLHNKGILHRDLKPENLLLTKDRHLKVTDFGTAGILKKDSYVTGDDCVGTAEYVSPEVLEGKKQTASCDIWSVGCILYHMLVGKPPFQGASEYLTFQKVMACNPDMPTDLDKDAKDLIEKILELDPERRIGASDIQQVRDHGFFRGVDWKNLTNTPPPTWNEKPPNDLSVSVISVQCSPRNISTREYDREERGVLSQVLSQRTEDEIDRNIINNLDHLGEGKETAESSTWSRFLISDEDVVFTGLIQKRSFSGMSLFTKKRQLILTSFPRILYVDPGKMKIKGEIPWSDNIVAEKKNRKNFVIHTKGKQYAMCCICHEAEAWVKAIKNMKQRLSASSS